MQDNCDTVRLTEVQPGQGQIDYGAYLRALDGLGHPVTLLMEHLNSESEYDAAATHIRDRARAVGVSL
jgi:sugar phosphate isomerase/epimerase